MPSDIIWPKKFLPGTTDNYVSNEVIVKDLTAAQVWPFLADISKWESYYDNCCQITPPASGPILKKGDRFRFSTFGFPPLPAEIYESVAPAGNSPGRIAWRAWQDGDENSLLEVYHAWIVEDLEWGVVRILTQESQIGKPAAELAKQKPNPMLLGHQNWLDNEQFQHALSRIGQIAQAWSDSEIASCKWRLAYEKENNKERLGHVSMEVDTQLNDEFTRRYQNGILQDKKLDGASVATVLAGDIRFITCIMLDAETLDQLAEAPQDFGSDSSKYFRSQYWVKMVEAGSGCEEAFRALRYGEYGLAE
ncbi:hypothetical protein F53441_8708 [Fusarium austroafricanum]|uniref:Uncharacterized protein n=1 Tax=Fusarium austroafricanum TaxID=2364996 RepID=A0A8H4KEZ0_9HYPO|nr:hypothetical protein F53441_8708 [Fusarium austroafricanum]